MNWVAGAPPTPNKVDVKLSADGKINLFNNAGTIDVIADVVGYYVDHDHDDRYYTKTQINAKLPATGSVIIGPAFIADTPGTIYAHDSFGCTYVVAGSNPSTTLVAGIELPVGVTITAITAMLSNATFGGNSLGGTVTLFRRTLGSVTELGSVNSIGLPAGTYNRQATLATPELVTSGRYYWLRYVSIGAGFQDDNVCGAEITYTNPG